MKNEALEALNKLLKEYDRACGYAGSLDQVFRVVNYAQTIRDALERGEKMEELLIDRTTKEPLHVVLEPPETKTKLRKKCVRCDRLFQTINQRQKFCSRLCRLKYNSKLKEKGQST